MAIDLSISSGQSGLSTIADSSLLRKLQSTDNLLQANLNPDKTTQLLQGGVPLSSSSSSLDSNLESQGNSIADPTLISPSSSTLTAQSFAVDANTNGLQAQYYLGRNFETLATTRLDGTVNFDWGDGSPDPAISSDNFSARWTGQILAKYSETYTFSTSSDDGVRLWVNGQQLIDSWVDQAETERSGSITLAAGQKYDLRLEYYENGGLAVSTLAWSSPTQTKEIIPQSQLFSQADISTLGSETGAQAAMSDSFVDSMGMNVSVAKLDFASLESRLLELGIRHIRTSTEVPNGPSIDPQAIEKLRQLGNQGIKSTLLWREFQPWEDLMQATKSVMPYVDAVEGPNETDYSPEQFSYQGQSFPEGTRAYQREFYQRMKADPVTSSIPVILTSVSWGMKYQDPYTVDNVQYPGLGNMEVYGGSQNMDYGNMHSYTAFADPPGSAMESWHLNYARKAAPTLPLMATEGGYNTAYQAGGVSEWAHSRYIPRWYLEQFRYGVERSYLYQLFDAQTDPNSQEGSYGLVRSDNTTKPAFDAVKNLIQILQDPGPSFTPQKLYFTLGDTPASVHHILLQKRTGDFYLVLWNDVKNFNLDTKTDITVPDEKVTLTLGSPMAHVREYLPLQGASAIGSRSNVSSVELSVSDQPLIVELSRN